ncbi:MAG: hypothetical protein HOP08_15245 [Cyclobacteriaceae bacterium]|nr:hypothetical protein [Cyclobacteriaceae bacterium]
MTFELLPTIDIMSSLYQQPLSIDRFQNYLKTLEGGVKGDLTMPISGFNPMAKEGLIQKLKELKDLGAEEIMRETLSEINQKSYHNTSNSIFKVALNLSDDVKGGWTNRFTSDYDSKFKLHALLKRKFCTPVFWASETFTPEMIKLRTLEYINRSIYNWSALKPVSLRDHVYQERFVSRESGINILKSDIDFESLDALYQKHKDSFVYQAIFNFFYGDDASASLGFKAYGMKMEMGGYQYSRIGLESKLR